MTNELDRRWRMIDRLQEPTAVAIDQKDWPEASRLVSTRVRLLVRNIQAIELDEPGFITYLLKQPQTIEFWERLGITDRAEMEAIHRGQIDPWSR